MALLVFSLDLVAHLSLVLGLSWKRDITVGKLETHLNIGHVLKVVVTML